jgi:NRPS condensation-like uncharacterized protein
MNRVEYLNELEQYYAILGEEKNKKGELFFVCAIQRGDKYDVILLKNINDKGDFARLNIMTESDPSDNGKMILKIADIIIRNKSRGNGSILMKYFFQYANKNRNVVKIIGTLSEIDSDHFDRIEHFYKKHDFSVEFNINNEGERISGYTEKEL